jgi:hypothetical protein
MGRVAAIGCIVCRVRFHCYSPAIVHHPRADVGGAQRESNWLVIPLCPAHHDGKEGFHTMGKRRFYLRFKLTEFDMLGHVNEGLARNWGDLNV